MMHAKKRAVSPELLGSDSELDGLQERIGGRTCE
jgi:hypothetical protein